MQASGLSCPRCGGGPAGERSLSAWRDGLRLTARCWRNKCGVLFRWDADLANLSTLVATRRPVRIIPQTMPMTDATVAALEARYAVQRNTLLHYGARQMTAGRALDLPVGGPTRSHRGWVCRWLDGTLPKVKGYPDPDYQDGPWLAWFPVRAGGLVVCVEDVFSALRLWEQGINAVALLGTTLSTSKVAELWEFATEVVVALDADATVRAIQYAMRQAFHVRRLAVDIKDMTDEALKQWTTSLLSSLPASAHGMPAN